MDRWRTRKGWMCSALVAGLALLGGCATTTTVASLPAEQQALLSDEDDYSQLIAQIRSDLGHDVARETERNRIARPQSVARADNSARKAHEADFAARAKALFSPLAGTPLAMPVVGVYAAALDDNWHAPRDGGTRVHKGIDIFARKGTPVVAVTDGTVSFIGDQPLGGHCVWLSTDDGRSFYYAHLDRWAAGLYEGLEVQRGDILGYVGNTGNARHTPSHLHFGINQNDVMVNPYPVLIRAIPTTTAHLHNDAGGVLVGSR